MLKKQERKKSAIDFMLANPCGTRLQTNQEACQLLMFTKLVKIIFSISVPASNFTLANTKSILFSDEKGEPK